MRPTIVESTLPEEAPPGAGPKPKLEAPPLSRALSRLSSNWMVLRDVPLRPAAPGQDVARLAALLLHPGFGIVLLEFEPDDTPDAVARFRLRLGDAGLGEAERALLPVLHLRICREHAHRLGRALEQVLVERGVTTGTPDLPWVHPVLQELRRTPDAEPRPVLQPAPERATSPQPPAAGPILWLAATCGAGVGAVALYLLASVSTDAPAPPSPTPPVEAAREAPLAAGSAVAPFEAVRLATFSSRPAVQGTLALESDPVASDRRVLDPGEGSQAEAAGSSPDSTGISIDAEPGVPALTSAMQALLLQPTQQGAVAAPAGATDDLTDPPHLLNALLPSLLDPGTAGEPVPAIILDNAIPLPARDRIAPSLPESGSTVRAAPPDGLVGVPAPEESLPTPSAEERATTAEVTAAPPPALGLDLTAEAATAVVQSAAVPLPVRLTEIHSPTAPAEQAVATPLPAPAPQPNPLTPSAETVPQAVAAVLPASSAKPDERMGPATPISQAQAAAPAPPSATLPPPMLAALLRRGEQMLTIGDISAARRLYERAAEAGSGAAALAAGRTHDPAVLAQLGAQGLRPDPAAAAAWYRRALALGEPGAEPVLRALGTRQAWIEEGSSPWPQ